MASKEVVSSPKVKDRVSTFESVHSDGAQRYSSMENTSTTISSTKSSSIHNGSTIGSGTYVSSGSIGSGTTYVGSGSIGSGAYVVKETSYLVDRSISREEEKSLFVTLNDRLAKYIEVGGGFWGLRQ